MAKLFHPLAAFREEMYLALWVRALLVLVPLDSIWDKVTTLGILPVSSVLQCCRLNFKHMPHKTLDLLPEGKLQQTQLCRFCCFPGIL